MKQTHLRLHALLLGILFAACTSSTPPVPTVTPSATSSATPERQFGSTVATSPPQMSPTASSQPTETAQTPTPTLGAPICPSANANAPEVKPPVSREEGSPSEIILDQVHTYLSAGGEPQELQAVLSSFTFDYDDYSWTAKQASVVESDLTGNDVAEVIVALVFATEAFDFSDGYLRVFTCSDGVYQVIRSTYIGSPLFDEADGLRTVMDLNDDGVPELVYSWIDNYGAHGYFTRLFFIEAWDGETFVPLVEHNNFYDPSQSAQYATVYNGDGTLSDVDDDGIFELVLENGIGAHYGGPQRSRTDVFDWDGQAYALARWYHEAPTYRFQAVQDGDDATLFGDFERALDAYQQAIFDEELFGWRAGFFLDLTAPTPPVPDPEEWPRLEAYSRYRILLLHAARDYRNEAQVVFDTLQEKFASHSVGGPYADLAAAFWEAFQESGDVDQACEAAVSYARAHEVELRDLLGPGIYGEDGFYYEPEDLCPFPIGTD